MTPTMLVLFPLYALSGGAVLELLFARLLSPRAKGWLALLASLAALAGVIAAWPAILSGQVIDVRLMPWDGPLSLAYHLDGLSLLFALMGTGIGSAVLLYSIGYMAEDPSATRFYTLMLIFIAGLVHLVFSADLLALYLSWEVIGLCSFLLVGFWYRQQEAARGARKVLVMTHLAGYGLLAAVLILFARTGTTLWTDPRVGGALTTGLFVLMVVAAAAKSVQFPLHTWIPDAMAAPTPVSALLHAACYVKAGVYLLARLHSLCAWPDAWGWMVLWLGTVTLLVGVLYALVQTDLKRMLAFHTVSQIGYMLVGLGLGTPLGVAAGLLHCLNHAFFKGGLFLCAGAVQHETGTRDMNELGGLARRMPRTAAFWLVCAGSIAGLPLMSGFVSKWLLYNAALEVGQLVPALAAWFASILTVFSFLKATSSVFLGPETPRAIKAKEAPLSMRWGMGILAAGSLVLGIAPQLAMVSLINPLLPALGLKTGVDVSWLGLSVASGSWWSTGGLLMAVVACLAGAAIYWLARSQRQAVVVSGGAGIASGGVFTGGEPLGAADRLPASDFSAVLKSAWSPFYHLFDVDRYYRGLSRLLTDTSHALEGLSLRIESRAALWLSLLVLALAALARLVWPELAAGEPVSQQAVLPGSWALVVGMAWVCLLLVTAELKETRSALPLMALSGVLVLAGLRTDQTFLRLALLETASLSALALVWQISASRAAARAYLAAVLISAGALVAGTLSLAAGELGWALALLWVGFAVKLALAPAYFWLPDVADAVPAPVTGLIVSVVDLAAFGEFWLLRTQEPALFAVPEPWLALGILSAIFGGLLMLAQRDLKRLLAFSSIEDMGYLVAGAAFAGSLGIEGAMYGALAHALAKALLFITLAVPEDHGDLDDRGLAGRYPLASAGFVLGMLAILGVPPLLGFTGRWRIYMAAYQANAVYLALFLLASALSLVAYSRALIAHWWGPSSASTKPRELSFGVTVAILLLSLALLALGLWPDLLRLIGG
jgi:multicomponent Na+:H+ antiporter subunit A